MTSTNDDPLTYAYLVHEVLLLLRDRPLSASVIDQFEGELGLVGALQPLASGMDAGCTAWLTTNESMSVVFAYEIVPEIAQIIVDSLHSGAGLPVRRKVGVWTMRALTRAEGTQ